MFFPFFRKTISWRWLIVISSIFHYYNNRFNFFPPTIKFVDWVFLVMQPFNLFSIDTIRKHSFNGISSFSSSPMQLLHDSKPHKFTASTIDVFHIILKCRSTNVRGSKLVKYSVGLGPKCLSSMLHTKETTLERAAF